MSSRRFLVVLLGILPLGVLASMNLMGALRGGEAVPAIVDPGKDQQAAAVTPAERAKLAKLTETAVDAAKPVVQKLEKFDFFGRDVLEDIPGVPDSSPFDSPAKSWSTLKKTQNLTVELGRNFQNRTAPSDELTAVEESLKSPLLTPPTAVAGSERIREHLLDLQKKLKGRDALTKAVKDAHLAYDSKKYADCLTLIGKILASDPTPETAREIEELKGSARFWQHWEKVPSKTEPASSVKTKLEALLSETTKPPTKPKEEEYLKEQQARLTAARSRVKVDEFFASPPKELRDLVEGCEQILEEDQNSRSRLGEEIKKHLTARLVEKTGTVLKGGLEEAKLKGEKYEQGVYRRIAGQNPPAFHCFKTMKKADVGEEYRTKHLTDFDVPPGPPQDALAAKLYNDQRRELIRQFGLQRKWTDFEESCVKWQQQLSDYYAVQEVAKKIEFTEEERLAHEVVELWPRLKPFLVK